MPPNMSVTISTPSGPVTAAMASADLAAGVLHVLVPADRHRDDVRQVADDGLGGVHQLGRQLPVRHDDDADHAARPSRPTSRWRTRAVTPATSLVARRSASAM